MGFDGSEIKRKKAEKNKEPKEHLSASSLTSTPKGKLLSIIFFILLSLLLVFIWKIFIKNNQVPDQANSGDKSVELPVTKNSKVADNPLPKPEKPKTDFWIKESHWPSRYQCIEMYNSLLNNIRTRPEVQNCYELSRGSSLCNKTDGLSITVECDKDNYLKEITEKFSIQPKSDIIVPTGQGEIDKIMFTTMDLFDQTNIYAKECQQDLQNESFPDSCTRFMKSVKPFIELVELTSKGMANFKYIQWENAHKNQAKLLKQKMISTKKEVDKTMKLIGNGLN